MPRSSRSMTLLLPTLLLLQGFMPFLWLCTWPWLWAHWALQTFLSRARSTKVWQVTWHLLKVTCALQVSGL